MNDFTLKCPCGFVAPHIGQGETPPESGNLVVLMPVYNDWHSVEALLPRLDGVFQGLGLRASVVLVNDCSSLCAAPKRLQGPFNSLASVDVVDLRCNQGHQRAIAVGLAYIHANIPCEMVVVMDSDGEDRPEDVPLLVQHCRAERLNVMVFAERTKRSETWLFRCAYSCYRILFALLTGQRIRVGNFSVIPFARLCNLVAMSDLWNHYAACAYKSRQLCCSIPTVRGQRESGKSTMNFVNLVIHGLSAISVNADVLGVRMLIANSLMMAIIAVALFVTVGIRLFTNFAIPGWATSAFGLLLVILLQVMMLSMAFCFIVLNSRRGTTALPLRDYGYYISEVRRVAP